MTAEFLTAEDVAALFKVTPQQIRSLARAKKLPAIRLGKLWRFERSAILAWASAQKGDADGGCAA